MSAVIDNRIIEMSFENKEFEKGVKQTLKTLEQLEDSLQLKNAEDGFQRVAEAAKGVELGQISDDLDMITGKFELLGNIGLNVLNRVSNKIIDMGYNIAKAFTIDPISQGWGEYELKMGNVQTILSGVHDQFSSDEEAIEAINASLDDLNTYADKTIYSFAQMTEYIGQFTNAGASLKDSTAAIKGITNLAALSGVSAERAGSAMLNLSQAFSSGVVRLEDWKTLENANMATEDFKNVLIEVGKAMKRVDAEGNVLNDKGQIEKNKQGQVKYNVYDDFRNSLSGGKWLTKEVMLDALNIISGWNTEMGRELTKADLVERFGEDIGNAFWDIAERAEDAATSVKTFTQLMDTLKEAAGSGWAQSMELLVGGYAEAKELFTDINERLSPIIERMGERRNSILEAFVVTNGRTYLWDSLKTVISMFDRLFWLSDRVFLKILAPFAGSTDNALVEMGVKLSESFEQIYGYVLGFDAWLRGYSDEDIIKTFGSIENFIEVVKKEGLNDTGWIDGSPLSYIEKALSGIGGVLSIVGKVAGESIGFLVKIAVLFQPLVEGVLSLAGAVGDFLYQIFIFEEESDVVGQIFDLLYQIVSPIINFVTSNLGPALELIGNLISTFGQIAAIQIRTDIVTFLDAIGQILEGKFVKLETVKASGWIVDAIALFQRVHDFITTAIMWIKGDRKGMLKAPQHIRKLLIKMRTSTKGLFPFVRGIKKFIDSTIKWWNDSVVPFFTNLFTAISDAFGAASNLKYDESLSPLENFKRRIQAFFDSFANSQWWKDITATWDRIKSFMTDNLWGSIVAFFTTDTSGASNLGEALQQRIDAALAVFDPDGSIRESVGKAIENVKTVAKDAWDRISAFLFGGSYVTGKGRAATTITEPGLFAPVYDWFDEMLFGKKNYVQVLDNLEKLPDGISVDRFGKTYVREGTGLIGSINDAVKQVDEFLNGVELDEVDENGNKKREGGLWNRIAEFFKPVTDFYDQYVKPWTEPLLDYKGEISKAILAFFTPTEGEDGKEVTWEEKFNNLKETIRKPLVHIVGEIRRFIIKAKNDINKFLYGEDIFEEGLFGPDATVIGHKNGLIDNIGEFFAPLTNFYNEHIGPFLKPIEDAAGKVATAILDLFRPAKNEDGSEMTLEQKLNNIGTSFTEAWNGLIATIGGLIEHGFDSIFGQGSYKKLTGTLGKFWDDLNAFLFGRDVIEPDLFGQDVLNHQEGIFEQLSKWKLPGQDTPVLEQIKSFIFGSGNTDENGNAVDGQSIFDSISGLWGQVTDFWAEVERWWNGSTLKGAVDHILEKISLFIFGGQTTDENGNKVDHQNIIQRAHDLYLQVTGLWHQVQEWWNGSSLKKATDGILEKIKLFIFGGETTDQSGNKTNEPNLIQRIRDWYGEAVKIWSEISLWWNNSSLKRITDSILEKIKTFIFGSELEKEDGTVESQPDLIERAATWFQTIKTTYENDIKPWLDPILDGLKTFKELLVKGIVGFLSPDFEENPDDTATWQEKLGKRFEAFTPLLEFIKTKINDLTEKVFGFRLFAEDKTQEAGEAVSEATSGMYEGLLPGFSGIMDSDSDSGISGLLGMFTNWFIPTAYADDGVSIDDELAMIDAQLKSETISPEILEGLLARKNELLKQKQEMASLFQIPPELAEQAKKNTQGIDFGSILNSAGDIFGKVFGFLNDTFGEAGSIIKVLAITTSVSKLSEAFGGNQKEGIFDKIAGLFEAMGGFVLQLAASIGMILLWDKIFAKYDEKGNKLNDPLGDAMAFIFKFILDMILIFGILGGIQSIGEFLSEKGYASMYAENDLDFEVSDLKGSFVDAIGLLSTFSSAIESLANGMMEILKVAGLLSFFNKFENGAFVQTGIALLVETMIAVFVGMAPILLLAYLGNGGLIWLINHGSKKNQGFSSDEANAAKEALQKKDDKPEIDDIVKLFEGVSKIIETLGTVMWQFAMAMTLLSWMDDTKIDKGKKVIDAILDKFTIILGIIFGSSGVLEAIQVFGGKTREVKSEGTEASESGGEFDMKSIIKLIGFAVGAVVVLTAVLITAMALLPKDLDMNVANWFINAVSVLAIIAGVAAIIGGVGGYAASKNDGMIKGMAEFLGLALGAVALIVLFGIGIAEYIKQNQTGFGSLITTFTESISSGIDRFDGISTTDNEQALEIMSSFMAKMAEIAGMTLNLNNLDSIGLAVRNLSRRLKFSFDDITKIKDDDHPDFWGHFADMVKKFNEDLTSSDGTSISWDDANSAILKFSSLDAFNGGNSLRDFADGMEALVGALVIFQDKFDPSAGGKKLDKNIMDAGIGYIDEFADIAVKVSGIVSREGGIVGTIFGFLKAGDLNELGTAMGSLGAGLVTFYTELTRVDDSTGELIVKDFSKFSEWGTQLEPLFTDISKFGQAFAGKELTGYTLTLFAEDLKKFVADVPYIYETITKNKNFETQMGVISGSFGDLASNLEVFKGFASQDEGPFSGLRGVLNWLLGEGSGDHIEFSTLQSYATEYGRLAEALNTIASSARYLEGYHMSLVYDSDSPTVGEGLENFNGDKPFRLTYGVFTEGALSQLQNGSITLKMDSTDMTNITTAIGNVNERIDALSTKIDRIDVILNTGELVGALVDPMNEALGKE